MFLLGFHQQRILLENRPEIPLGYSKIISVEILSKITQRFLLGILSGMFSVLLSWISFVGSLGIPPKIPSLSPAEIPLGNSFRNSICFSFKDFLEICLGIFPGFPSGSFLGILLISPRIALEFLSGYLFRLFLAFFQRFLPRFFQASSRNLLKTALRFLSGEMRDFFHDFFRYSS